MRRYDAMSRGEGTVPGAPRGAVRAWDGPCARPPRAAQPGPARAVGPRQRPGARAGDRRSADRTTGRRQSRWTCRPRSPSAPGPSARCRHVDLELDPAGEIFQLLDPATPDELAERDDDRVGLGLESEELARLLDQLLRKIERGAHMISPILYVSGCQLRRRSDAGLRL